MSRHTMGARTVRVMALAVTLLVAAGHSAVWAQGTARAGDAPAQGRSAQASSDGFVQAGSLQHEESLPAAPLVIGAYGFVWVVLLVYVWTLWRRESRVERDLRALEARLAGERRE